MSHPRNGSNEGGETGVTQVVDFKQVRQSRMEEKRRNTQRIFFKNLMSVYCVVGDHHMRPIELIDVSEDGCSFQVPFDGQNPWPNTSSDLPMRLYFSQDTYVPVVFRVQNSTTSIDNGVRYQRFGCSVDKTLSSYPAYEQFVRFLGAYSEHAHKDKGDVSVFYL